MNKCFPDATAALFDVSDGARVMVGGFGLSGNPENCIRELAARGTRRLTLLANNCGNQRQGLAVLLQQRQVAKFIGSFAGDNPDLQEQYLRGEVEVEFVPQGTFAERIRAGGAGIGAFFTPTGVGTEVAEGKETRTFDGVPMVLETALKADFALVRAACADTYGNLRFYGTSRNFSPAMAMAARVTIAEVEEIVEVGAIPPDDVHLPGLFVDRIFVAQDLANVIEHRTVRPRPVEEPNP